MERPNVNHLMTCKGVREWHSSIKLLFFLPISIVEEPVAVSPICIYSKVGLFVKEHEFTISQRYFMPPPQLIWKTTTTRNIRSLTIAFSFDAIPACNRQMDGRTDISPCDRVRTIHRRRVVKIDCLSKLYTLYLWIRRCEPAGTWQFRSCSPFHGHASCSPASRTSR